MNYHEDKVSVYRIIFLIKWNSEMLMKWTFRVALEMWEVYVQCSHKRWQTENTMSITYAWACEDNKTAPLIHAEHADFIFK